MNRALSGVRSHPSATAPTQAPRSARRVGEEWRRLGAATPEPIAFDLAMVAELPEPARRWLSHAISPGTPLWRSVEVSMVGEIRLGKWRPFTATQIVAPPGGYIWAARTRLFGIPVVGYDRMSSGTAEMRWRLLNLIPVMTARGPDTARSAAGRLASEIVLIPTSFREAAWTQGRSPDWAVATWPNGGQAECAELHVGAQGQVLEVLMQRWGNPGGEPFGRYPFGVSVSSERTDAGVTIAADVRAGWWWGTDRQGEGEFFRARITAATFR
jgi:hypothetical protein